jgi:hypothetical protein
MGISGHFDIAPAALNLRKLAVGHRRIKKGKQDGSSNILRVLHDKVKKRIARRTDPSNSSSGGWHLLMINTGLAVLMGADDGFIPERTFPEYHHCFVERYQNPGDRGTDIGTLSFTQGSLFVETVEGQ